MASDSLGNALNSTISQIHQQQRAGEWELAANLLATHAVELLDRLSTAELAALFAPFPAPLVECLPDLWFAAGLVQARLHDDVAAAYTRLKQAAAYYTTQDMQPDRAAWIYLELARLEYARDEFAQVQQYIDRAAKLMQQNDAHAPANIAFLDYMIASLCGDTGRVAEGLTYAQRAAHRYHLQHNPAREFRALLVVCSFAQQLGRYPVALDALSRAHACYETGRLESASFEALLNAETHLAWYRGHLEEALTIAQTWVRFSQGGDFRRQRLYAHWMLGNILRALGRYPQALDFYEQARHMASDHTPNFVRWIDAQEAWLAVLQGDYAAAETLIHRALVSADEGQGMSFQVNLGVIELLTGRWESAERRLRASLAFYARSQDRQATCAITFHLAYLQIERGMRVTAIVKLLRPELKWLESGDNAFYPFWWHPTIVGRVAALLLGTPEFHAMGRRFFREGYLGAVGDEVLRQVYLRVSPAQRAEISELLTSHGVTAPIQPEGRTEAEHVIAAAIEQGQIELAHLSLLFQQLRTAQQRNRDNSTIVAVFLLHLQGAATADIALRLNVSRSAISHMLQIIYETFGVSREVGSRIEQRCALQQAVRAQKLMRQ
jgi:tetratricopeptide (TPR) repeat protein